MDFGTPTGHEHGYRRPPAIVSANRMNTSRAGLVIVVPVTRNPSPAALAHRVESDGSGLRETSYAKCEGVKSVSRERLVHHIGRTSAPVLHRITAVIRTLIDD